jgi:hypothetical protein
VEGKSYVDKQVVAKQVEKRQSSTGKTSKRSRTSKRTNLLRHATGDEEQDERCRRRK